MAVEEKKFLGTAAVEQLIANTRAEITAGDEATLNAAKQHAIDLGVNYDPAGTAATKVQELAEGQVKTNADHIGTMDNLETTAKADLVTALNEVRNAVSAGGTAAAITLDEQTSGLGDGILKAYVLKQGENTVGTINIPKDMVVQSGEVVTNPEGQEAGTYIKLVLANATNDVIYVNVGNLVDIYRAKAGAAQVQLTVDSATREISAVIVAGSITATELAADAVTTVKIADGNVTKAKLSTEVQTSLGKADVAEENAKAHADSLNTAMNTRVESVEAALAEGGSVDTDIAAAQAAAEATAAADAKAKADQALVDAKAYADSKVAGVDLSGIATNASDIDKLEASLAEGGATANAIADAKQAGTDAMNAVTDLEDGEVANLRTDVDALKAVSYVEITADEINAMFAN